MASSHGWNLLAWTLLMGLLAARAPANCQAEKPVQPLAECFSGFVANEGQYRGDVRAGCSLMRGSVDFLEKSVRFSWRTAAGTVRGATLEFVAADTRRVVVAGHGTARHHWMRGQDRADWVGTRARERLRYEGIWPGIDLEFTGSADSLKSTWYLQPGIDPATIAWHYHDATGVTVKKDGSLSAEWPGYSIREQPPVAWQVINGVRLPVNVAFELRPDGHVGFRAGVHDHSHDLVIDPTLRWSTPSPS